MKASTAVQKLFKFKRDKTGALGFLGINKLDQPFLKIEKLFIGRTCYEGHIFVFKLAY